MKQSESEARNNRRSFLKKSALAAGAATMAASLLTRGMSTFAQSTSSSSSGSLSAGDIAILRFLAAAELIESDLWTQYAELGGIGDNPPIEVAPNQQLNNYQIALSNLDGDGPQYITSNTIDEISHATFLNGYLES
ncbi:MAG TPA: twin-arginine translocation signal domain-containing protein, partial [Candidatus Binatus sp.]|nr:twin-arginine translocation signal domain-containing protein [Candidatus Binatus sp.]